MNSKYRKVIVWDKAHRLTLDTYRITSNFPQSEIYGITSQLRSAASSVPANIAEGYSRGGTKQYINFLTIANGSLAETTYFLLLAHELGYIDEKEYLKLEEKCEEIGKMLNATIRTLRDKGAVGAE
ncbi:MAG: four helix bundle protein [Tissierellia bacterium]|nr:four helix bundle protein [Tissierellia bacterium]